MSSNGTREQQMSDEELMDDLLTRLKAKEAEADERIKTAISQQEELSEKISDEGLKISASVPSKYWR